MDRQRAFYGLRAQSKGPLMRLKAAHERQKPLRAWERPIYGLTAAASWALAACAKAKGH